MKLDHDELYNQFDNSTYSNEQQMLLDSLYNALFEKNIHYGNMTEDFIFWSKPECMDSLDAFFLEDDDEELNRNKLCTDIGNGIRKSISEDKCDEEHIQIHCPVTCDACCQDSVGKIFL
mmetsp:Transcript_25660/g.31608  ORF Transcript_25660/g.31608 Transcript_25660/m.31608 type:complete len:119 (+) Transcript_25660:1096-1452(+)